MPSESRIMDLMERWNRLRISNPQLTPEDLCQDCPDLLEDFRKSLANKVNKDSWTETSDFSDSNNPVINNALRETRKKQNTNPSITSHQSSSAISWGSSPSRQNIANAPSGSSGEKSQTSLDHIFGLLPCMFGRYQVVERLGSGGMGTVYLAHDTILDCTIALKIAARTEPNNPSGLERFRREARTLAALRHESICRVLDFGEIDGIYYIAMDHIEGDSLGNILREKPEGFLDQRNAADLVCQVARALEVVHSQGVIHRDIKPSNILLDRTGRPMLVDFGLARRMNDYTITEQGSTLGTPIYMSPEQIQGENTITSSTDIYSLGIVLYQVLTGELPFGGENLGQIFFQVLNRQPTPPSTFRDGLNRDLEVICLKAIAKKPQDRFASMGEMAKALETYLHGDHLEASLVDEIASRDLVRIAPPLLEKSEPNQAQFDIGFFRARLRSLGGPTESIICGYASARLIIDLPQGMSCQNPRVPCQPDHVKVDLEVCNGNRLVVYLKSINPSAMFDGRLALTIQLEPTPQRNLECRLVIQPDWYTVETPYGLNLDGATRVVVDTILRKLLQSVSRSFTLGDNRNEPS